MSVKRKLGFFLHLYFGRNSFTCSFILFISRLSLNKGNQGFSGRSNIWSKSGKGSLLMCKCISEFSFLSQGTPVQNDLQEFYALIEYVNPGILGPLCAYKKVYEEPIIRSRDPSAAKVCSN